MARRCRIILKDIIKGFKKLTDEGENKQWMEDIRGNLAMVATVIATVTFQMGLNPPSGIVQNGEDGNVSCSKMVKLGGSNYECPGISVIAGGERGFQFSVFVTFNNLSFASSLLACFFLVSRVPLHKPLAILLMAVDMCFSLGALGIAYCVGVFMTEPQNISFVRHLSIMISVIIFFAIVVFYLLFCLLIIFKEFLKGNETINAAPSSSTIAPTLELI
ncbi:hypothetical protein HN51_055464 [Arachis hypogaea]|uniref:PGG domain-containing protein n=2 Tax=Arachis hypogaea TaxID=3818 RepID=A0A444XQM0_ARAHY|nr:uncharacterized protein LOC110266509 [Arachis ipaensis]XP_025678762.1 uncharacterized protein LOC112778681 [Arachis hypogaea]QHO02602.1 uncharacterized protein DS421_13g425200 [Arachis hypogaea]RYQ91816.1 hypothetical protein Ahy_B09g097844 isoform A [Arachis hypogaea]